MNELMQMNNLPAERVDPAIASAAESAKARIQSAYVMAYRKPRNADQARDRIIMACKRPAFAEKVEYNKPVGGKAIKGPSVRFAELALKEWGNVLNDSQLVYEDENVRRVKIFCTDLETNLTHSKEIVINKTVERKKPTEDREIMGERINSKGEKVYIVKATDDEINNKEAALISKALRNEGLRLIPSDIIDEGVETARITLKDRDSKDPTAAKKKLLDSFSEIGIQPKDIEQFLGHRLDMLVPAEIQDLRGIYRAIKDGEARWSDYIHGEKEAPKPPDTSAFDKLIEPLNVDIEKLNLFIAEISKAYNITPEHVKVEAVPRFEDFWKAFCKKYGKQPVPPENETPPSTKNKTSKTQHKTEKVEETIMCPNLNASVQKSGCAECTMRQGCPALE